MSTIEKIPQPLKKIAATKNNAAKPTITAANAKRIVKIDVNDSIQIIPRNERWAVKLFGAKRAIRIYSRKSSAIHKAETLKDGTKPRKIFIYNGNGEVTKIIE